MCDLVYYACIWTLMSFAVNALFQKYEYKNGRVGLLYNQANTYKYKKYIYVLAQL